MTRTIILMMGQCIRINKSVYNNNITVFIQYSSFPPMSEVNNGISVLPRVCVSCMRLDATCASLLLEVMCNLRKLLEVL